jgi:uncharacterized HAD superfamily protein
MTNFNRPVVVDVDGTLANTQHRKHFVESRPKDWAAWNDNMVLDTVHEDIRQLVTELSLRREVIICTGREDTYREVTEKWLTDNQIPFDKVFMRRAKDYRKDSIVKTELLDQIRQWHGEPFVWLDDRNQVVNAIREAGVRVLQVAPGDF